MQSSKFYAITSCIFIVLLLGLITSCTKPLPEVPKGTLFSETVKYNYFHSQIIPLKKKIKSSEGPNKVLSLRALNLLERLHAEHETITLEEFGPPDLPKCGDDDCHQSETEEPVSAPGRSSNENNEEVCVCEGGRIPGRFTKPLAIDSKVVFYNSSGKQIGSVDFTPKSSTQYKNKITGHPINWTKAPEPEELFYIEMTEKVNEKEITYSYPYRGTKR